MPTYHDVFANVENLPLGYALVYRTKGESVEFGSDDVGYYISKSGTAGGVSGILSRALPHKQQSYTASVKFRFSVTDITLNAAAGVVVGGNTAANKFVAVKFSTVDKTLKLAEWDYEAGSSTTLAETTETYTPSNNTDYILEVTVTPSNGGITVDAALKDTTGNTLLSLSGSASGHNPIFGLSWVFGLSQTGKIYFVEATINFTEEPNVYKVSVVKSPDMNIYDYAGCPRLVFFEHPDGSWKPYHPVDGYPRVVLRWHDEAGDAGKKIMMYKIVGDPRDPASWVGEGQVFDRDQLGWESVEEFCLLWRKNDTWIALAGGLKGGTWSIYRLISDDLGVTWTEDKVLKSGHKHINIWVDEGGLIHALYNTTPPSDIIYGQSLDLGETLNDIRTFSGYSHGSIYCAGDKYIVALHTPVESDGAYYSRAHYDIFETIDFNTLTKIAENIFQPIQELPFTLYMNGGGYSALLRYNNSIFLAAEMSVIDHDPDDTFQDQKQRHTAVYQDPVAEYVAKIETSLTLEATPHIDGTLKYTLKTKLTDAEGNPLQGKLISFYKYTDPSVKELIGQAETNENGEASIEFETQEAKYVVAYFAGDDTYASAWSNEVYLNPTSDYWNLTFGSWMSMINNFMMIMLFIVLITTILSAFKSRKRE